MGSRLRYRLVYGSLGRVSLGESDDEKELQKAADKLNKQAPHYNHRVEPVPVVKKK